MLTVPNTKCLRADKEDAVATPAAETRLPSEPDEEAGVPNEDEDDEEEPTNLRTIPDFEVRTSWPPHGTHSSQSCRLHFLVYQSTIPA